LPASACSISASAPAAPRNISRPLRQIISASICRRRMLALARARCPDVRFADMDLREIGKLQPESFDFIFGP